MSFNLAAIFGLLLAACTGVNASGGSVASAYYPGWHAKDFPPSAVPWKKYTSMTYAFALTTPDVKTLHLEETDQATIPKFVELAKNNGVKALVSIGGWTGSRYFSAAVGNAANRTAFVKTVTDFATKYKLDGLDFDWEYPGNQGIGCNIVSPNDTAHFASFLTALRKDKIGKKLILTAATPIAPWVDASGNPSASVEKFAEALDYIQIMDYDIWGPWSATVGPNAPLNDTCAPANAQAGSAASAVASWIAAGMPRNKIVLGVAGYGHSFIVSPTDAFVPSSTTALAPYPKFDASQHPAGDKWDDPAQVDSCGVQQNAGGIWDFWGLIEGGFLNKNGSVASGMAYRYDTCSQTPYVYNKKTRVMVSYDDTISFAAKGAFIKSQNLKGFAIWHAGGDSKTLLLDSIRKAAGF